MGVRIREGRKMSAIRRVKLHSTGGGVVRSARGAHTPVGKEGRSGVMSSSITTAMTTMRRRTTTTTMEASRVCCSAASTTTTAVKVEKRMVKTAIVMRGTRRMVIACAEEGSGTTDVSADESGSVRQLLGMKGAAEEDNIWKVRSTHNWIYLHVYTHTRAHTDTITDTITQGQRDGADRQGERRRKIAQSSHTHKNRI